MWEGTVLIPTWSIQVVLSVRLRVSWRSNKLDIEVEQLSVVVPTRNEAGNIGPLVRRIADAASGLVGEVIFVDDSDDQTPEVVERVADKCDIPVRLIHRQAGERSGGLGSAVLEGMRAARNDWVLVMDGDLQHPPELIPDIAAKATGNTRVVVASRMADDEGVANWSPLRQAASTVTMRAAKTLFPRQLSGISDPLTGFFLVDRTAVPDDLEPDGFKILLEILVRGSSLHPKEIGFSFADRVSGTSKASMQEGIRFAKLLTRLRLSRGKSRRAKAVPQLRYRYDIHGVMTIASQAKLPELDWFRTDKQLSDPDIVVRIGRRHRQSSPGLEFKEWFGWAGFAVQISHTDRVEVVASRLVGWSSHVLYTNVVEAILRWEFVSRGYALVHSACVVKDGLAYLVTARTDTGKTTTALKLLEDQSLEFLSDDLSLVTPEGTLLTYPKPMTMSYHTVQAVNPDALTAMERLALQPQSRLHSRSGRRVGLGLAKTSLPAATANAIVQFLVPPPKYPVTRILPGIKTAVAGVPQRMYVIAKGPTAARELDWDESAEMLLANCEDAYGFPPYTYIEEYLLGRDGDLRNREAKAILAAVADCPTTLLQSPNYGWDQMIREHIDQETDAILVDLTDEAQLEAEEPDDAMKATG